ncbi:PLP-dependent aminotransferase family protein [Paenibacillus sp. BR2-3]|uniref:MocR-like pyridoxine biosynthesis transcription factor PdxR n=1 Tax=Paenibacillus sp. BR2-3 TaxID=3048494 RepID=UPI003977C8E6
MMWILIDKLSDMPLIRQVYEHIRTQILRGELKTGDRLPSSRELAFDIKVSRNVVIEAYEQLIAEGYLESRQGSGTYVAEGTFLEELNYHLALPSLQAVESRENPKDVIDFRSGIPDLDLFPRKIWGQLAYRMSLETSHTAFGYGNPEGRLELRLALTKYLLRTRGIRCTPEQIVVTSGATQAFSLIAKLLLKPGDEVVIEDPVTHEIQTIFTEPGSVLCPVPVDGYGMKTDLIPPDKKPAFIFVTPSHQFPLGGILPIQRRLQLIKFARATDCYIVEDDYDSEFRYLGPPISSLQGLEPERVIYVGTFSKILSPGLRVGYLILPPSLTDRCRNIKWFNDLHSPSLEQLTLARFIEEGHLERHVSKMKKIYRQRRETLINSLTHHFPNQIKISGHSTGLHFIVEFTELDFTKELLQKIYEHHVRVYPVELHTICKEDHNNKLILGYGNVSMELIEKGILRLRNAMM